MSGPPIPPPPERMASVLSAIAAQARRTNLTRTAEIRAVLDQAASGGLDRTAWTAAERTAHQLAGSAGTFGFRRVSHLASSLEGFLAQSDPIAGPDPARLAEAQMLLDEVTQQLTGEPELD